MLKGVVNRTTKSWINMDSFSTGTGTCWQLFTGADSRRSVPNPAEDLSNSDPTRYYHILSKFIISHIIICYHILSIISIYYQLLSYVTIYYHIIIISYHMIKFLKMMVLPSPSYHPSHGYRAERLPGQLHLCLRMPSQHALERCTGGFGDHRSLRYSKMIYMYIYI